MNYCYSLKFYRLACQMSIKIFLRWHRILNQINIPKNKNNGYYLDIFLTLLIMPTILASKYNDGIEGIGNKS